MKKLWSFIKSIPWWAYVAGIVLFGLQFGLYKFGNLIADVSGRTNSAWLPKIDAIDNAIKLCPPFVIIYILSYVFWIISFIMIFKTNKKNYINFISAYILHLLIGTMIFAIFPSKMDRATEGIYDLAKNGEDIFSKLLFIVYNGDGGTKAMNLFPSFHCSISLICFIGFYKANNFSKVFKAINLLIVILISLSTLFTKQHYFADMLGGYTLAFLSYLIIELVNPSKWFIKKE